MAFFMAFPYTDLYQLNLDWLLETVKRLEQSIGDEVVNSFNTRSGAVELNAEDVNALMIETVYIGDPGEVITDITPAELQEMYNAGKRMLLLRDSDGLARELYLLDLVGDPPAATATKYIPDISGDVVTAFNNRSGRVALLASDVNNTRIDITWISDPGDSISDLSQSELDEMYNNGVRVLIFVNNLGRPDQLYFLALVSDVVTPQAYSPASSESGVLSVNGRTGAVILYANNITLRSGVLETVDGALTSIRNSVGTLSSLTTDDKTSIVAALNEVDSNANTAATAAATAQTAANNAASAAATAQSTADGAVTAAGTAQTTANNAATAAATAQNTADAAVQSAANVAADVGDIADLETSVTTDVVSAVNSLNDQIVDLNATFTGATGQTAGAKGLVPAPTTSDVGKFLSAGGGWETPSGGGDVQSVNSVSPDGNGNVEITGSDIGTSSIDNTPISTNLVNLDNQNTILQEGIAIIVDGDTASVAVPVGGYAYVKNNTHGLTEGVYKNTSSSAFPVTGGTADATVFTIIPDGGFNQIPKIETVSVTAINQNASVQAYKYGYVLIVVIPSTGAIPQSTWTTVATLNINYNVIQATAIVPTAGVDNFGQLKLNADGTLQAYQKNSSSPASFYGGTLITLIN